MYFLSLLLCLPVPGCIYLLPRPDSFPNQFPPQAGCGDEVDRPFINRGNRSSVYHVRRHTYH